ncbi:MAG: FKBP-type peptidyl-prolyl cis-trans isomerase [Halioglobus sp.]|nr:FKBP-type peptidyl-prolyl cis-trans isomerase [Halioglobus sp.]
MKKFILPVALLSAALLQACSQPSGDAPAAAEPAARPATTLDTTEERLSYGIAYNLGQGMATESFPVNVDAFMVGLADAIDGKDPQLTREELTAEMQSYQESIVADKLAEETAFLAEQGAREGIVTTKSGLLYEVVAEGEGDKPTSTDTVSVHYRGTLPNGQEFDSSYSRGQPAQFRVDQVIPGWTEALQLMAPGAKLNLVIPSALAYGAAGAPPTIRPYSTLLFEVELLEIVDVEEPAAEADAAEEPAAEG